MIKNCDGGPVNAPKGNFITKIGGTANLRPMMHCIIGIFL